MIINLTKSVPLQELCKISAISNASEKAKLIEVTFSSEAIIGFATELLWLYQDINDENRKIITTHQLRVDPAPNQAIGFYLTPNSPVFVLKTNSLEKGKVYHPENCKEIRINGKNTNQYYNVIDPDVETGEMICLETYELSRRNIVDIKVLNDNGEDITKDFNTIIFEINRKGIKELASMLLIWAHNCKSGDEYLLCHASNFEDGYNLGVILTEDSIPTKFKCNYLQTVYEYDDRLNW